MINLGQSKMTSNIKIDTSKITQTVVNFIVPLVCLIISIVALVLFAYPSYKSLPVKKLELAEKEALREALDKKLGNLKKLVDYKTSVDQNSQLINTVLASESQVPQLLTQIDQIAKESGFSVTKLSYAFTPTSVSGIPQPDTQLNPDGTPVVPTPVTEKVITPDFVDVFIGATSNIDQIQTFLEVMEKAARYVEVENFRYALNEKENVTSLDSSFSLKSPYLFVDSKAVTDDPVNLDITSSEFTDFISEIKDFRYYNISIEDINEDLVVEASPSKPSNPAQ